VINTKGSDGGECEEGDNQIEEPIDAHKQGISL